MVNEIESEAHKPYENIWVLKTDDMIPNLTWWWWWWIFFIKDPDNPGRTKQFMILWSTKYTDDIQVMDMKWKLKQLPTLDDDGVLKFNGMTAAWWYDGKKMYDPIVLEEMDFEVRHDGESGELKPLMELYSKMLTQKSFTLLNTTPLGIGLCLWLKRLYKTIMIF